MEELSEDEKNSFCAQKNSSSYTAYECGEPLPVARTIRNHSETVKDSKEILDGRLDDKPETAFYMIGVSMRSEIMISHSE
jgi:F0F1-type ATP synthase beta subunit